jgi:hypothetical protein
MMWRLTMLTALLLAAAVARVLWVLNAGQVDHWLAEHTGTVNEQAAINAKLAAIDQRVSP